MRKFDNLCGDRSGTAAAEMALVAPFLLVLMFGAMEMGKYFLDDHLVVKAVRDGARYASRQSFASMPCGGTATNEAAIKNVVRYGKPNPATTDKPRLYYWTDPATVTVSITCYSNVGTNGARVYNGIYTSRANVPRVSVSATVPYVPLLGAIGFNSIGVALRARNEAAVSGL